MRIPAVNVSYYAPKNVKSSERISFQKKPKVNLELTDRISHLLPEVTHGDIVTVGTNIKEVQVGLSKFLEKYSSVIKRIFHINAGVTTAMAFTVDDSGDYYCHNIGEKSFALVKNANNEQEPDVHFAIDPDEKTILEHGDTIINGKNEILLMDWLSEYANTADGIFEFPEPTQFASKVYDFSKIKQAESEKINKLMLNKLIEATGQKVGKKGLSFKDVGGLDKTIHKLKKGILFPIEYPYAFENREKINKGVILYGPPGTGKTLLAQALSNESNAYYIKLNGLEMASKWVGESEENWRKLFSTAKENQPSIIFIDEFDAVGRSRNGTDTHGDNVVNQILTLMDNIEKENQQVFVVTATNKIEALDEAIALSGRFGEHIEVPAPDRKGREQIFDIHTRKKQIDKNFDRSAFLDKCDSLEMTGADIAFIVDKAHEFSWERSGIYEKMEKRMLKPEDITKTFIAQEDFLKAFDLWSSQKDKNKRRPIGF